MSIKTCTLTRIPARHNQHKQPHRVVCLCKDYECRHQVYPDTNGVSHPGVEVLPETRAAHQRADVRNNLVNSARTASNSVPASPLSAHDSLISDLQQLNIISAPDLSNNQLHHQMESDVSSPVNQDTNFQGNSSEAFQIESPNLPAPNVSSQDPKTTSTKTCSKAELARISGQQVFDCGMFHNHDILQSFFLQKIGVIDVPSTTVFLSNQSQMVSIPFN